MERTPGKWKYKVNQREVEIRDGSGSCVAFTHWTQDPHVLHDAEANAAYIVRAVNCHDDLLGWVKIYSDHLGFPKELKALIAEAEGGGNG